MIIVGLKGESMSELPVVHIHAKGMDESDDLVPQWVPDHLVPNLYMIIHFILSR